MIWSQKNCPMLWSTLQARKSRQQPDEQESGSPNSFFCLKDRFSDPPRRVWLSMSGTGPGVILLLLGQIRETAMAKIIISTRALQRKKRRLREVKRLDTGQRSHWQHSPCPKAGLWPTPVRLLLAPSHPGLSLIPRKLSRSPVSPFLWNQDYIFYFTTELRVLSWPLVVSEAPPCSSTGRGPGGADPTAFPAVGLRLPVGSKLASLLVAAGKAVASPGDWRCEDLGPSGEPAGSWPSPCEATEAPPSAFQPAWPQSHTFWASGESISSSRTRQETTHLLPVASGPSLDKISYLSLPTRIAFGPGTSGRTFLESDQPPELSWNVFEFLFSALTAKAYTTVSPPSTPLTASQGLTVSNARRKMLHCFPGWKYFPCTWRNQTADVSCFSV